MIPIMISHEPNIIHVFMLITTLQLPCRGHIFIWNGAGSWERKGMTFVWLTTWNLEESLQWSWWAWPPTVGGSAFWMYPYIYSGLNGLFEEILGVLYFWAKLLDAFRSDVQYHMKHRWGPLLGTQKAFLTQCGNTWLAKLMFKRMMNQHVWI